MAAANYSAALTAAANTLAATGKSVAVEEELAFAEECFVVYLTERQAPETIQPLATGFKARFTVVIDVECRAFSLSLAGAVKACDALIKLAEDALLPDPTLGGTVLGTQFTGGELASGQNEQTGAFVASSTLRLECEMIARYEV